MSVVNTLNNFFDAIYVITLERAKERHHYIEKELAGLNYKFHWGVDGHLHGYEDFIDRGLYDSDKAKELRHDGNDLTLGEIGCSLAHREVYEDMLANNYKKILILEDDVWLDDSSENELNNALRELPDNWELLYLGYRDNLFIKRKVPIHLRIWLAYPILYFLGIKRYNPFHLKRKFPRKYSKHLDLSGHHYGTHAYGLTARGAEKLLVYQTPVALASDYALATLCMKNKIKSYNVKKRVVYQNREKLQSMIGERFAVPERRDKVSKTS